MCGIVGVAGDLLVKHERVFSDLLVMNQLRGFDSIGVTRVGTTNTPNVVKTLANPADLIRHPDYKKLLAGSHRVLLGHNRWATVGDVNVMNAHPFTHGHITGVHNGTVSYRRDFEDHARFEVDSDNIFHHINKKGYVDLWQKLWGAAALVWWDEEKATLNFLRNKDRPLFIAFDKDRKVLMWASEFYMLYAAANRNGVIFAAPPTLTSVDTLFRLSLGDPYKKGVVLKLEEEKIPARPVVQYTYKPAAQHAANRHGCPDWLVVGTQIDCMFDSSQERNNFILFEGWSPLDDRVNIRVSYIKSDGMVPAVDLKDKYQVYRGTVNTITRVYIGGVLEFEVKVVGVHKAIGKDGKPVSLDDKKEDKELAKLIDEMAKETKGEDDAPFDVADIKCSVNCSFKQKKTCMRCRQAFAGRNGVWTSEHGRRYFCDWCGSVHNKGEEVYITSDKDESYCANCFSTVVNHLFNRDFIGIH